LPIAKSTTLVYGSNDGGSTVVNKMVFASRIISKAAAELHLSQHTVQNVSICLGGDVELHLATDQDFYLLDLARTFPPESPRVSFLFHGDWGFQSISCIFYRMLRPELLRIIKRGKLLPPVSSDSFSNWGIDNCLEHNAIADLSSEVLFRIQIPELTKQLDSLGYKPESMSLHFHAHGVNMRHLALVGMMSQAFLIRSQVSEEICIRVLKQVIRARLRCAFQVTNVQDHIIQCKKDLHVLLGNEEDDSLFSFEFVRRFGRYSILLVRENMDSLDYEKIFIKACLHCGIALNPETGDLDMSRYSVCIKDITYLKYIRAKLLLLSEDAKKAQQLQGIRLLQQCVQQDRYSPIYPNQFVSHFLKFLEGLADGDEDVICDDEDDEGSGEGKMDLSDGVDSLDHEQVKLMIGLCSELVGSVEQLQRLVSAMRKLDYKQDMWLVVEDSLPNDAFLQFSLLKSSDKSSKARVSQKIIAKHHKIHSTNTEEKVMLFLLCLRYINVGKHEFMHYHKSFRENVKALVSQSLLGGIVEFGCGLKFPPLCTPFSYYHDVLVMLHNSKFLREYLKSFNPSFPFNVAELWDCLLHNCMVRLDSPIWKAHEQSKVFVLMIQLMEGCPDIPSNYCQIVISHMKKTHQPSFDISMPLRIQWFDGFEQVKNMFPGHFEDQSSLEALLTSTNSLGNLVNFLSHDKHVINLTITHFNNLHEGIGDEGSMILASFLESPNCQLKTLSLKQNHIGSRGCSRILEAICRNCTLESIDLSLNDIGFDTLRNFESLIGHPSLNLLNLTGNQLQSSDIDELRKVIPGIVISFEDVDPTSISWYFKSETNSSWFYAPVDSQGRAHGTGTRILFLHRCKFVGTFHHGLLQGHGIEFLADGSRYEGNFVDSQYCGFGKYYYADGKVYEGEWKDGIQYGKGKYRSGKGAEVEATWESGNID
jgi:hypothetical protein